MQHDPNIANDEIKRSFLEGYCTSKEAREELEFLGMTRIEAKQFLIDAEKRLDEEMFLAWLKQKGKPHGYDL